MPQAYQDLLKREQEVVTAFLKGASSVLDVGCGDGRMIPVIAPLVEQYVGIDINSERIARAKRYKTQYPNIDVRVHDMAKSFAGHFDKSVALFHSLGCMSDDVAALKNMAAISGDLLFTVHCKGSLPYREEYYRMQGIPYTVDENETITSNIWGKSRSYSYLDVQWVCKQAGLHIKGFETVGKIGYIVTARV